MYNFRESLELYKKLIREEQEDPLMKEYSMCELACKCKGSRSYDGCTLIYKCKSCEVLFTWGPWERLSDPTTPVAFHDCFGMADPHNPKRFLFGSHTHGVGELFGIVWGDKNVDQTELDNSHPRTP